MFPYVIDRKPPIQAVLEKGIVPRLVGMLSCEHERGDSKASTLAIEAAWCITNIACGGHECIQLLLDCGVVVRLKDCLLNTMSIPLREQCLWAISNLATDTSGRSKDELLSHDIMTILLWYLDIDNPPGSLKNESPALTTMRYTTWILCSLCKYVAYIVY